MKFTSSVRLRLHVNAGDKPRAPHATGSFIGRNRIFIKYVKKTDSAEIAWLANPSIAFTVTCGHADAAFLDKDVGKLYKGVQVTLPILLIMKTK